MARKYQGGQEIGVGYDMQSNRPLDERDIVQTQIDLLNLENCYPGIEVKVEDESYVVYKWNGVDQTNIANWTIQTSSGGGSGDGDMLKSDYAFDNNTVKDSNQLNGQEASAYMTKAVYDPDGNNIVTNSEKLGGQNPSYYDQGQALTDHVDNTDVHLSTDERAAIDNTPNEPTALNPFATQGDLAAGGNGDMLKSVYDQDNSGVVDNSDALGGELPSVYDQRSHVANTSNPHATTKADVNLGNVDNTADLQKPISNDQQAALDTKLYGITAGTGISVNGTDPLSPTISTTPQTTAGVIYRQYFTGDQETTTSGTFYTTSDDNGTVAETIQSVICTNGQTNFYEIDYLGGVNPFDTQLYAGTYAGQMSVRADEDKDFNRWAVEVYLCDDQGAPTPSGVTGAPVGDLGVQVLAILNTGQLEFKKDEITQVGFSGALLQTLPITTGQRARYHISATNTGTSGDTVTYEVFGGFDHMTFIDTPITLSASDIYNDSPVNGSTVKTALEGLDTNKAGLDPSNPVGSNLGTTVAYFKGGLAPSSTITGTPAFVYTESSTVSTLQVGASGVSTTGKIILNDSAGSYITDTEIYSGPQQLKFISAGGGFSGSPFVFTKSDGTTATLSNSTIYPNLWFLNASTISDIESQSVDAKVIITKEYGHDKYLPIALTQAEYDALTPIEGKTYYITDAI